MFLELTRLRNAIVKLLYEHTKRPVVMLRQNADKPLNSEKTGIDYPFLGYNFVATYINDKGTGNYKAINIDSKNPRFKVDLLESLELMSKFSMSFTAYSKDEVSSKDLAMTAWEFFKFRGYHLLARENLIVVDVMNVGSRDIFDIDDYERREGFDVIFRRFHKIESTLETIETYKIDKEVD